MTQAKENGKSWARARHAFFHLWLAAHPVGQARESEPGRRFFMNMIPRLL